MSESDPLRYDIDRDELLPFVPNDAHRLLDVGAANGRFGMALRRRNPSIELWAVEPEPERARLAAEHFDHVVQGTYPDDSLPLAFFDVLTFNDVLEHLVEPLQALVAAKDSLRSGGIVVASIPNVRHRSVVVPLALRGEFAYEETGLLDRTHLRFFTRKSAVTLFEDAGYSVESITGVNPRWHWSDPFLRRRARWLRRLLGSTVDDFLFVQYVLVARPT